MNYYDLIFVNSKETVSEFHTEGDSAAVPTLIYYLNKSGIKDTISFPRTEKQRNVSVVREEFRKFLKQNYAPIFGISFWTNTHSFAMDFAQDIREIHPEALIITGGPHYASDEEIKKDLEGHLVDIIFKGGAEPFFQFASSFFVKKDIKVEKRRVGLEITGKTPEGGIHYLSENGEIIRRGSGKFNYPVYPLVHLTKKGIDIRIMVNDVCVNSCDYCVIDSKRMDKKYLPLLYEWLDSIKKDIRQDSQEPIMISFSDSAPFARQNKKETEVILEALRDSSPEYAYDIFLDPADIDGDFFDAAERYNIRSFFLGRDRIVEDHLIGRRLRGAYRTQGQLDKEYQNIKDLLEFLRHMAKKRSQEFDVYIGYIISPFEKEKDSQRIVDEIIEISSFPERGEQLRVQANVFILNPYPGTKVAERLVGKYIPMGEFYYPVPNAWVSKDSNTLFLEYTRLIIEKMFCNLDTSGLYRPLFQLCHDIQFNKEFDWNLVEEVEDKTMKALATYVIERILGSKLGEEKNINTYFDNLLKLHYLGCMIPIVLTRPELFKRRDLLFAIKREDVIAPLLKNDLQILKKAAEEGRAPCLEKYL